MSKIIYMIGKLMCIVGASSYFFVSMISQNWMLALPFSLFSFVFGIFGMIVGHAMGTNLVSYNGHTKVKDKIETTEGKNVHRVGRKR